MENKQLEGLLTDLDKTHTKVKEQRKEMFNRIDALIGELNHAKTNII